MDQFLLAATASCDHTGSTVPAPTVNRLFVGFTKTVELPQRGLFIHDEIPKLPARMHHGDVSVAVEIFDPSKHSFNPLKGIDHKGARALADVLFSVYPQGENTLRVRDARIAIAPALLASTRLDQLKTDNDDVQTMISDILFSPVLKYVFCRSDNQFSFNPNSLILARLNRAELGDFDTLVLGLFLIGHFPGQIAVPDFGFYGHNAHISLIREERLVAGVNFLGELPPKLRNAALLIDDKVGRGTTFEDAQTLADYERKFTSGQNGYITSVERFMAS